MFFTSLLLIVLTMLNVRSWWLGLNENAPSSSSSSSSSTSTAANDHNLSSVPAAMPTERPLAKPVGREEAEVPVPVKLSGRQPRPWTLLNNTYDIKKENILCLDTWGFYGDIGDDSRQTIGSPIKVYFL